MLVSFIVQLKACFLFVASEEAFITLALAPLLIGWTSVGVFTFYSQFMNHDGPLWNSATCQRFNSRCPYIFWLYILFWSHKKKKKQLLQFCSEFTYAHHWNEWDSLSYLYVMLLFQEGWKKKKFLFFSPHMSYLCISGMPYREAGCLHVQGSFMLQQFTYIRLD